MKAFIIYTTVANSFFYNLARALNHLGNKVYLLNAPLHVSKGFGDCCQVVNLDENCIADFLKEKQINGLLIWNGSNNLFLMNIFKDNGVKIWFFENGYLPATLQMNLGGVNAEASYNTESTEELYTYTFTKSDIELNNFVVQNVSKLNLKSYLLSKLKQAGILNALVDIIRVASSKMKKKLLSLKFKYGYSGSIEDFVENPFLLLPLQVNNDTQIIQNSNFKDMYQILDTLAPLLINSGYDLVVKEHPEETSYVNYKKYSKYDHVHIVKNVDLNTLINKAACVITVNSSVGFQAIQKNKKVITLGNSFYNSAPGVFKCNLFSGNFLQVLEEAINNTTLSKEQNKYVNYFNDEIFITGNWKSPDKKLIKECVDRLLV